MNHFLLLIIGIIQVGEGDIWKGNLRDTLFTDSSVVSGSPKVIEGVSEIQCAIESPPTGETFCFKDSQCSITDLTTALASVSVTDPIRCFLSKEESILVTTDRELQ